MDTLVVVADLSDKNSQKPISLVKELAKRKGIANVTVGSTLTELGIVEGTPNKGEAVVWIFPASVDTLHTVAAALPNLKWIHSWITGVNRLKDLIEDKRLKDVVLTNSRSAFSRPLAEYVMAVCLYFTKNIPRLEMNKKKHLWDNFTMGELRGKTMGFVGFGNIAQTTARVAKFGFEMRIIALRRSIATAAVDSRGMAVEGVEVDEMFYSDEDPEAKRKVFSKADFVVCTLPETPKTIKFCGAAEFAAMKPTAVFISIGRGTAVDEKALIEMLEGRVILGAGLDVFEKEPLAESNPLWQLDNVLLSSHNADVTLSYDEMSCDVFDKNLSAYLEKKPLLTVVDKIALY